MQYREAAVRISQTAFTLLNELHMSGWYIQGYVDDGKMTADDAAAYTGNIQAVVDSLETLLGPVYDAHPDLRPRCCGCEAAEEDDQPGHP